MTKEELKQEAEESAKKFFGKPTDLVDLDNLRIFKNGYLAGAEPREKQIQIDAEQIRALQKQNGELTDENERLKGDLELWESGACRATNLDKCGVVKELEQKLIEADNATDVFNAQEKRIAELEEENANVKEALEGYKKIAKWCDKCDKIAELEKENAEAKERIKTLEYRCENIKDTDTMELVALQRENAELKAFKEKCKFNVSDIFKEIETENNLTKAKELLKRYVPYRQITDSKAYKDLAEETEQFLNSEVEK